MSRVTANNFFGCPEKYKQLYAKKLCLSTPMVLNRFRTVHLPGMVWISLLSSVFQLSFQV